MDGKIGLEEHLAREETLGDSQGFGGAETWADLRTRLLDIQSEWLRQMDAHGIEIVILSLNSPTVQAALSAADAGELARRANDMLAEEIERNPKRFRDFAALPMQDPDLASRELERCITELGFKGALVNGYGQVSDPENAVYYDAQQ